MPRIKTNSSAKKRFKLTGSGKVKCKHAFKNHILTKKSHKRKKALGKMDIVDVTDQHRVKRMLVVA